MPRSSPAAARCAGPLLDSPRRRNVPRGIKWRWSVWHSRGTNRRGKAQGRRSCPHDREAQVKGSSAAAWVRCSARSRGANTLWDASARSWQNSNCAPMYSRAPSIISIRLPARAAQSNRRVRSTQLKWIGFPSASLRSPRTSCATTARGPSVATT